MMVFMPPHGLGLDIGTNPHQDQRHKYHNLMTTLHLTLKMTTTQAVETSVTNNSLPKDYSHPDDHAKQITLNYILVSFLILFSTDIRPNFKLFPASSEVHLERDTTVTLKCAARQGVPKPSVSWVKDGVTLTASSDGQLSINKVGSLSVVTVRNARPSDTGYYTCVAKNIAGEVTATPIHVNIYGW